MSWLSEVDTEQLRCHVVRLDSPDGKEILGTGVSVAPGVVLTCAHVVKTRTDLSVVPFTTGVPMPGTVQERSAGPPAGRSEVVWPFPDLAIVHYDGDPIGNYALLSTAMPSSQQDCVAWGYPRRVQGVAPVGDPAAFRFTGLTGDHYLSLKDDVARPGLSGAPLVCPVRRAVTGLVAATRNSEHAVGGWAAPIAGLVHPDAPEGLRRAGAELLVANRRAVLADRSRWHAVLPVVSAETALTQPWGSWVKGRRPDPADLLLPDFGVVSYLFRDAALDAAEAWCLDEGEPIAVGTVAAAGGMGKTRFGLELAKRMTTRHAWVAGEVGDVAADTDQLAALPLPRLLLIDYAESRPAEALSRLIERLSNQATDMTPARVVLVVRERAGRIGAANATIGALRVTATAPLRHLLDEREDYARAADLLEPGQREVLYETAVRDLAAAWQSPTPSRRPKLDDADYQQPLAVLYEALDAVLGDDPGWSIPEPNDPFWGPDPVFRVLAHEEKYWQATAPPGEDRTLLRACVALATLAGADTDAEADNLLATLPPLEGDGLAERRAGLRRWLAALYRGPAMLNPLRPDRLGEALVRTGLLAEFGAGGVVRILEASSNQQLVQALTVLTRCLAQSNENLQLVVEVLRRSHTVLAERARDGQPDVVKALALILTSSALEPLARREIDGRSEDGSSGAAPAHEVDGPTPGSTSSSERSAEDDIPKLVRGLPDGEITRELRSSRDAELTGRYGDALAAASRALADAEALPEGSPDALVLAAVAKAQVSASLLRVDGDSDEAWLLAEAAADPSVLQSHAPQFFVALLTKAEAALRTHRITTAKAALDAARIYADSPGDERMLLQVRAMTALSEHDHNAAVTLYSQAADSFVRDQQTEPDTRLRARWQVGAASSLLNKGLAQQRSNNIVAATESFHRAAAWYHESGSLYDESVARRLLAHALFDQKIWADGHKEVDLAIQLAHGVQFWSGEAEALELRGRALATQDDPEGAREALKAAHALLRSKGGSPREQRRLLQVLATIESQLGHLADAEKLLDEALRIANQENDALAIADIDVQRRTATGTKRADIPAPDEVVAHLAERVRAEERPGRAAMLSHKLAGAYRSRGELEPAERWYGRAHQTASSIGNHGLAAAALIGLAELALHNDNVSMAEQQLDRATATADGIDDPELVASLKMFRARILAHRNDYRTAQQVLSEALNIAVSSHLDDLAEGIKDDLEQVDIYLSLFKPAMSLKELAAELSRLESWYPEQRAALRRFWYYWRDTEILANLRAQSVSKALFVAESANSLQAMSESLGGLFEMDIFVPESSFARNEQVNQLVPFPADHQLPFCVNVVTVREMQDDINQHLEGV